MMLTLSAGALRSLLVAPEGGRARLDLVDLPRHAREVLGFHGLTLCTGLLAGVDRSRLEAIRERADKVGCACLLLVEREPLGLAEAAEARASAAIERGRRVLEAAHVLGCSAIAVQVPAAESDKAADLVVERVRRVSERAERLDLNLLLSPCHGLTSAPDRLTDIIKRIGGFRVGTYPDFQAAAAQKDPGAYLRRLAPYAAAVCAATVKFVSSRGGAGAVDKGASRHEPYDLGPMIEAIRSVGFEGNLAVDFRGAGDATLGVTRGREALEALVKAQTEGE